MIDSIRFGVKQYQFNPHAPKYDYKTDCILRTNPLRKKGETEAQGLVFTWTLTLSANDIELLYYASEEFFVIADKNIADDELLETIQQSYNTSYQEVAQRNLKNSLDAAFPPFDTIPIDLPEIRKVLDM